MSWLSGFLGHAVKDEHKKVAPPRLILIFQQCVILCMKFYIKVKQSNMHFIVKYLVEIHWKTIKLRYFNQDHSHFS